MKHLFHHPTKINQSTEKRPISPMLGNRARSGQSQGKGRGRRLPGAPGPTRGHQHILFVGARRRQNPEGPGRRAGSPDGGSRLLRPASDAPDPRGPCPLGPDARRVSLGPRGAPGVARPAPALTQHPTSPRRARTLREARAGVRGPFPTRCGPSARSRPTHRAR